MGTKISIDQQKIDILALARLTVKDPEGNEVLISSFWKSSPVVMIFLRHFSCIACRTYVNRIWQKKDELKKNKTKVVFIGNGSPQYLQYFKEDLGVMDAQIYTDPTLETFKACGLIKGVFNLIDPRGVMKVVEFALQGQRQGSWDNESGTHTQMGGIIALKPPGRVIYHYIENFLGDFDLTEEWKSAVKED